MYNLIYNYGPFALFLIIVAIVYIEAKHNPKMLAKAAELAANDRTSVLIANIKDKKSMADLKNLLPEMHATCLYNKATVHGYDHSRKMTKADVLNIMIWNEYYGQRYYLICTEHPEVEQSYLPFLTN